MSGIDNSVFDLVIWTATIYHFIDQSLNQENEYNIRIRFIHMITLREITSFVTDIWYDANGSNDKGYQHEDLAVVERCNYITYGHCEKPLNAAKIHSTIAVIVVEIQ